ncbi:peptide MFS transporter [Nannocystaceae bacterium ST9]
MPVDHSASWFGHPRGLAILFGAELWERFSYYGMRALLVLYVIGSLDRSAPEAYALYGVYGALVYAFGVVGGAIAQRWLGEPRAIIAGGVLMAAGHLVMALPWQGGLYWALALLCVGNGLFKPNVSSNVGALYTEDDPRRTHAFYVFYMGINLGAMLAPIVCGAVAERYGWHVGFGLAGVGMLFGLAVVIRGRRWLRPLAPEHAARLARPLAPASAWALGLAIVATIPLCALLLWRDAWGHAVIELVGVGVVLVLIAMAARERGPGRAKLIGLLVLMVFHTAFWAAFEQVGSSFTLLAEDHVDRRVAGMEIPASSLVAINAALIIGLAPLVAWFWRELAARGREPSTPAKFALGLVLLGAGFLVFALAIACGLDRGSVSLVALLACYLLITLGELCLSPIGLALVGRLAPAGASGFCMGAWFMTYALAHLISAWIATLTAGTDAQGPRLAGYAEVFVQVGVVALGLALILVALRGWLASKLEGDAQRSSDLPQS